MRVDYVARSASGATTIRSASGARVQMDGSSAVFKAPVGEPCSLQQCEVVDLLPSHNSSTLTRSGAAGRQLWGSWWSNVKAAVAIWRRVSPPPPPPPPFSYLRDSDDCLRATRGAEMDPEYMALFRDSASYAREYAEGNGWSYDGTAPSGATVDSALRGLRSIYKDGAQSSCSDYSGVQADICALLGVWKMQLGTKEQILSSYRDRARQWSQEKLTDVRRKDALWSWTYSRYFYQDSVSWAVGRSGYENKLYLSDNRETAMMELIVQSLMRNPADTTTLDRFYDAYVCANKEKYELMAIDVQGAADAVRALSGVPRLPYIPFVPLVG